MSITLAIKQYAKKSVTPLQFNFLKNYALAKSKDKNLEQSKFLKEELSIRLSHRVFDLLELPYGLPLNNSVKDVIKLYCQSFDKIKNSKIVHSDDVNNFADLLIEIKSKHRYLEENIAKGLLSLHKELDSNLINNNLINQELDKFFLSRIGIRTLITQNTEIVKYQNSIIKECKLVEIINDSINNVNLMADRIYESYPPIEIISNENISFSYIPSHIYYIMNEIIKNALVAQINSNKLVIP